MGKNGMLNFEEFGYSMPVSESLFVRPPFRHKGVDVISVSFETNYDAVSKIVPEQLNFVDEVPQATLVVERFKNALIPNYLEAMIMFHCSYNGNPFMYMPSLLVTASGAMVTGREVWGYPKKPAQITLDTEGETFKASMKRPSGTDILSVSVKKGGRLQDYAWDNVDGLVLKQIPSAEHKAPDVCKLVGCPYYFYATQNDDSTFNIWEGEDVNINIGDPKDPWSAVPVDKITKALVGEFDTSLTYGYEVYDYLK